MGWIFENLFLIFIIVSGIIAVLGDNKKKDQGEQQKRQRPQAPPQRQSNSAPRTTQRQPRAERQVYTEQKRPNISTGSIQEQQQEQLERLANKFSSQAQNLENVEEKDRSTLVTNNKQEKKPGVRKQELRRRVSNNLDAEGLVNGVIMSEVLGSPRAKKPYRSVVHDRTR